MGNNRVVITGIGVIAPNGIGVPDFHNALLEGRSGIRHFPEHAALNFRCQIAGQPIIPMEYKQHWLPEYYLQKVENKGVIYATLAGLEAWKDAGMEQDREERDPASGIVFGSGALGLDSFNEKTLYTIAEGNSKRLGSRIIPESMNSAGAAYINKILGLGNRILSNSSACITGSEAVIMGYEHLKLGKAKRMLCGSTEGDGMFIWGAFDAMRVLCSDSNDRPTRGSRPMSADSSGFVPSGGAGALVLETLESAEERGATIYAEILGAEINSGGMKNGGTMTAPNPSAVVECIERTIDQSGIDPHEIDLINGHLTSTKGDPAEIESWKSALKLDGDDFPLINTPKSMIGHCIGAAGSVELVAAMIQMKHGFAHRNLNLENIHPEILDIIPDSKIPRETVNMKIDTLIKANFGFGDLNCAIVIRNWN